MPLAALRSQDVPLTCYVLVFGVSFPLSAEAVETFGPMHVPIAIRGYENLFVALANRKRVDGSTLCSSAGRIRCAPKMGYLICILDVPQYTLFQMKLDAGM